MTRKGKTTGKTFADFVHAMITVNKAQTGYDGLHTTFGLAWADGQSFNSIVAAEFGVDKETVIATTRKMVDKGNLASLPAKGGVRLYLPQDAPKTAAKTATPDVLATVAKLIG